MRQVCQMSSMCNVFHQCVAFSCCIVLSVLMQNVGLALKLQAKQVEVAKADLGRLDELVRKPALAALHRDLKVSILNVSSTQPHDSLFSSSYLAPEKISCN